MTEAFLKGTKFNPTISLGNIITIVLILLSGLIGYIRLQERVSELADTLKEHTMTQKVDMDTFVRKDLQALRNQIVDERFNQVDKKLNEILAKINKSK